VEGKIRHKSRNREKRQRRRKKSKSENQTVAIIVGFGVFVGGKIISVLDTVVCTMRGKGQRKRFKNPSTGTRLLKYKETRLFQSDESMKNSEQ
jgi:hypothetical protein